MTYQKFGQGHHELAELSDPFGAAKPAAPIEHGTGYLGGDRKDLETVPCAQCGKLFGRYNFGVNKDRVLCYACLPHQGEDLRRR